MVGIYKIQSIRKPKYFYIGSTIHLKNRFRSHLCELRKGIHSSNKLQYHYNNYGEKDLIFIILIECDKKNIIETEQFFLDSYNPYFNAGKRATSPIKIKILQNN